MSVHLQVDQREVSGRQPQRIKEEELQVSLHLRRLLFVSRLLAFLQRALNLVQGLLDAERCESGRRVLVPALLHQLHQSRESLRTTRHRLVIIRMFGVLTEKSEGTFALISEDLLQPEKHPRNNCSIQEKDRLKVVSIHRLYIVHVCHLCDEYI